MKKILFALFLLTIVLINTISSDHCLYAQSPSANIVKSQDYYSDYTDIFNKMKKGMSFAPSTDNVSLDFVLHMIPHHEGAINMSKAIIKYGTNDDVKKIAQNIITSQEAEMSIMQQLKIEFEKEEHSFKGDCENYLKTYDEIVLSMFKKMESVPLTGSADEAFLRQMIYHHEGAIDMANNILKYTKNPQLRNFAENIVTSQSKNINEMRELLKTMKSS